MEREERLSPRQKQNRQDLRQFWERKGLEITDLDKADAWRAVLVFGVMYAIAFFLIAIVFDVQYIAQQQATHVIAQQLVACLMR